MDAVLIKAHKLYELELRGVGGEKENAKKLLDKYLSSNGLTREIFNNAKKTIHYIHYGMVRMPYYSNFAPQVEYCVIGCIYKELGMVNWVNDPKAKVFKIYTDNPKIEHLQSTVNNSIKKLIFDLTNSMAHFINKENLTAPCMPIIEASDWQ